jgi:uncharacterized repeat protein (TIGR03803 family)
MTSVDAAQAGPVKVLYAFKGNSDGAGPDMGVVSDRVGNLFGTTYEGGGGGCNGHGCGTIFEIGPHGAKSLLHAFKGGSDGAQPDGVVLDQSGNLYGTTEAGGNQLCKGRGCGTVYKLGPDGTETLLHVFNGGSGDGANPKAGLLRDKAGNLYGTTIQGGAQHGGTVFKISPDGNETVLYSFCSQSECSDGVNPTSVLIADKLGNLYGTTQGGGSAGWGTVFKIAESGSETVLHNFCSLQNCPDGAQPYAGVTMDKAGNLYGTTLYGGKNWAGVIFEIAADGSQTVFHTFDPSTDGGNPQSGVIVDRLGNLFGTVPYGQCNGKGSPVYSLSPGGSEKLYCAPAYLTDGVIERSGTLYGTGITGLKSKYAAGVVFAVKI